MGMTSNYLVCYDITEDDIRYQVANHCKNAGLVRIQYSVFYGQLERSRLAELKQEISDAIKEANGDIHFLKVCQECEKDHQVIGAYQLSDGTNGVINDNYDDIREELDQFSGVLVL